MKKRTIYITMSLGLIMALSQIVSAETYSDDTGDVAHWEYTGTAWGWEYNLANKPNIDITELSYSTSEGKVTITMKVIGSIESSEFVAYWAMMNTSDSTFLMTYSNGEGGGYAMNTGGVSGQMDFEPVISVNGNTLSCTYNISSESFEGAEFWGYAAEYTNEEYTEQQEWWGDWAPNSNSPFYGDQPETPDDGNDENDNGSESQDGNESGGNNGGTPGFELLTLFVGLIAVIILIRKRKL